jgi:D-inositol-3-phosphate glycosyltransferase
MVIGGRADLDGDNPEAREGRRLRALAVELGVSQLIQWEGAVDHEELPRYYRAADVTVMPSTYESFGLVAVESMACGTPVVAARVGGLQATVQDGVSGFLLAERDPSQYAERIGALLSDPGLRDHLGEAARHRAEHFGWRHVAQQLWDLYHRLIETPRTQLIRPLRVAHG